MKKLTQLAFFASAMAVSSLTVSAEVIPDIDENCIAHYPAGAEPVDPSTLSAHSKYNVIKSNVVPEIDENCIAHWPDETTSAETMQTGQYVASKMSVEDYYQDYIR